MDSERIILGSGKLYCMVFTGEIPEDTAIETDTNQLAHIKGGASLEYTAETYTASGSVGGYMKDTVMTKAGRFPVTYTGSSSTYLCDYFWLNTGIVAVPLVGGNCNGGLRCGACVSLNLTAGAADWYVAPGLSCKMPNAA